MTMPRVQVQHAARSTATPPKTPPNRVHPFGGNGPADINEVAHGTV